MKETINNALSYIGKKFDELILATSRVQPQIDVKLTDMPPAVLDPKEMRAIVSALEALKKVTQEYQKKAMSEDKRFAEMVAILDKIGGTQAMRAKVFETALLTDIRDDIKTLSDKLKDNKKDKLKDPLPYIKKTNDLLRKLSDNIEGVLNQEVVVDMSELGEITKRLNNISDILATPQIASENPQLTKLTELMEKVAKKKFKVPDVFKLDEDQLRQLRTGGMGGGGGGGGLSQLAAMKATMANVAMASADTEYSYTLPPGTTSFYIKIRSQNTKLLFAWVTGKMPTSGDGSAYMTISQNGMQSRPGLDLSDKTIYFQSAGTSQVCEIESYQ